jgi:hypothetical protein
MSDILMIGVQLIKHDIRIRLMAGSEGDDLIVS